VILPFEVLATIHDRQWPWQITPYMLKVLLKAFLAVPPEALCLRELGFYFGPLLGRSRGYVGIVHRRLMDLLSRLVFQILVAQNN
jgi:hypothetical protein